MDNKVIAIAGPTAVGKTAFAIRAAEAFGGEVISCDSMQLYKYMDIGSAKPSPEELARVPHHLIGVIDPRQPFSVAEYQKIARESINDVLSRGKLPIVSGGTGLYLNSLIYDMDFSADPGDRSYRDSLKKLAEKKGNEAVHALLRERDPESAEIIHPNNIKRTIRALERLAGGEDRVRPFDEAKREKRDYDWILVCLTRDREELYNRINERVDKLVEAGLIDEVRNLMDMGLTASDISMKGIGYKEIIAFLNGEYDIDTAIETVEKNTRHYAKRQLTWYRRYDRIYWLNISDYSSDEEAEEVLETWLRGTI